MAVVNPNFINEIRKFGGFDTAACFNCGNCTVVCPLSSESTSFPRKMIRCAQLGLENKILEKPDIWLCDFCAQCSETCPRQAEPGQLMMAMRRYATSKYGWSWLSRKLYTSPTFTAFFIGITSLIMLAMIALFHGPIKADSIHLFDFLPTLQIEIAGIGLGVFVIGISLTGLVRMYRSISRGAVEPVAASNRTDTARLGLKELVSTIIKEILAQLRYVECEEVGSWATRTKTRWFMHMTIFWGFLGLLLTTAIRFTIAPTHGEIVPISDPIRLLGTISGLLLIYGTGLALWKRLKRRDKSTAHSTHTDWIFLILIFLAGLTGFFVEISHYANLPLWTYGTLVFHLIIVFQLVLLAPFTKFAHSIFRPMAILANLVHRRVA